MILRKNREIPLYVLNPEVREILLKMCSGKSVDDYVFGNRKQGSPSLTSSVLSLQHVEWPGSRVSGGTT